MDGFSFAYMKEAFVATLLVIAANHSSSASNKDEESLCTCESGENGEDLLNKYELGREMVKQVKLLRDDMDNSTLEKSSLSMTATPRNQSHLAPSSHDTHAPMLHATAMDPESDFQSQVEYPSPTTSTIAQLPDRLDPMLRLPHRQREPFYLVGQERDLPRPESLQHDPYTQLRQNSSPLEKVVEKGKGVGV